jgi:hypothetical protein
MNLVLAACIVNFTLLVFNMLLTWKLLVRYQDLYDEEKLNEDGNGNSVSNVEEDLNDRLRQIQTTQFGRKMFVPANDEER